MWGEILPSIKAFWLEWEKDLLLVFCYLDLQWERQLCLALLASFQQWEYLQNPIFKFFWKTLDYSTLAKNPLWAMLLLKKNSPKTDTQELTSLIVLKIYFETASCDNFARQFNAGR